MDIARPLLQVWLTFDCTIASPRRTQSSILPQDGMFHSPSIQLFTSIVNNTKLDLHQRQRKTSD